MKERNLTFTMIGYYNCGFQMAGDWLSDFYTSCEGMHHL